MDLNFDRSLIRDYRSPSQIARVLTENWTATNMFCPRCGNLHISHFGNNKPVADFYCSACNSEYELKSKDGNIKGKISDGAYQTMIERITCNNNPDLFCMRYEKSGNRVIDFIFISKYFFTPNVIEKRKPLKDTARRAGWVGCNILISKIPEQAKIGIILNGRICSAENIVDRVQKCDSVATEDISVRGWLSDVLNCINAIGAREFALSDVYGFERKLSVRHPENNNVRAKIRQQLQLLRDKGFISFSGNGRYKKLL